MRHYCEHAARLGSDRFERPLSLYERARLSLHVLICKACKNYLDALDKLHRLLEEMRERDAARFTLSEQQRQHIAARLQQPGPQD